MIPLLLLLALPLSRAASITVDTPRGPVQGFEVDLGADRNQTYFGSGAAFLGIPYAKAPIGERRFTLPERLCRYSADGTAHDATYYRPRCWQVPDVLQPPDEMDEDCLFLNVITPDVKGSYPVLFYIPGGSFTTGGADVYHWKGAIRNLVSRGIVVVTINYRVGVIGFFTTFTERFPPNRGIYDMIQALQWVNEDIAHFGGDPTRITIAGQSAGASAVSHLSLSPLARGLFQQMIQTSGDVLFEVETPEPVKGSIHKERAQQICAINDTAWGSAETDEALMECLLAASPQEIIAYDMQDVLQWAPTIDGAFLPDYPENLAKLRPHYPIIFHDMLEEAASTIYHVGPVSFFGPQTSRVMMQGLWYGHDPKTIDAVSDIATAAFSKGKVIEDDNHLGWMRLVSDIWTGILFDALLLRDVKWQIESGNPNVWLFTLVHRSPLSYPMTVEGWVAVPHCSDLPYLWFYPDSWEAGNYTESDLAVADHIGRIWSDFVKDGTLLYDPAGPSRKYIEIDESLRMKANWRETADQVFNVEAVKLLGNLPILDISQDGWDMLNKLGPKIVDKWTSRESCSADQPKTTAETMQITTSESASTSVFLVLFTVSFVLLGR